MITPTDLWIAYGAGFAGGLVLWLAVAAVGAWRARRRAEIERRHWRAVGLFRG
jgi:hypothetical protein